MAEETEVGTEVGLSTSRARWIVSAYEDVKYRDGSRGRGVVLTHASEENRAKWPGFEDRMSVETFAALRTE